MKRNIILTGFMGSGKTTVGIQLSYRLKCRFEDTDKIIEKEQGCTISEIFDQKGEEAFRNLETECLKQLMEEKHPFVLSVGGGLVVREKNRMLLEKLGTVVYLRIRPETVYERLKSDTTRPLLQSSDPFMTIKTMLAKRISFYEGCCDITVDVDGKNLEEIVNEIIGDERTQY